MESKMLRVRCAREGVSVRRSEITPHFVADKAIPGGRRDVSLIYPGEVVEVPDERYYRERIRKGDLALAPASAPATTTSKTEK
jgi:hypothetical protein